LIAQISVFLKNERDSLLWEEMEILIGLTWEKKFHELPGMLFIH